MHIYIYIQPSSEICTYHKDVFSFLCKNVILERNGDIVGEERILTTNLLCIAIEWMKIDGNHLCTQQNETVCNAVLNVFPNTHAWPTSRKARASINE